MKARILLLLRLMLSVLAVCAIGKVLFMYYNAEVEPFGLSDVCEVWWHGLSMDASIGGYLLALPWLCVLISIWWKGMPVRPILLPYLWVVGILLALIAGGDTILYEFWKFKLNATIFSYMQNPEGATSSVSLPFMLTRVALILLLMALYGTILTLRLPKRMEKAPHRCLNTVLMMVVGGLLFLCIRGGVQESVMNVGKAYYSQHLFLNHSAVNPAFSLLSSIGKSKDFSEQFDYFSEEERTELFRNLYPTETEDVTDTLLNTTRPHVLVVLMESFGAKFVEELGGIPNVAPNMSRLIPEGILWENFYANSFRTDRGTVSAFSGWVSYPTASLMRLPEKLNEIPSIAHSLQREGYATSFLYGGDIDFMNTKGYLLASGYETLYSAKDFSYAESTETKWGVNDSLTAMRTYHIVAEKQHDKPWHMTWQTLSSHEPWEVPYQRLEDEKLNAFAYTDQCVGELVDSLKTLPVWDNLLVILMPDHGCMYNLTYEDPEFFHCPMLWLGGAIREPRRIDALMNQSDLAATLLSQMGISHRDFPWSRNVLSRNYTYPFVYSTYPGGILYSDSTGVTVYDISGEHPIAEKPAASMERIKRAKAILQTSYDLLDEM